MLGLMTEHVESETHFFKTISNLAEEYKSTGL